MVYFECRPVSPETGGLTVPVARVLNSWKDFLPNLRNVRIGIDEFPVFAKQLTGFISVNVSECFVDKEIVTIFIKDANTLLCVLDRFELTFLLLFCSDALDSVLDPVGENGILVCSACLLEIVSHAC